MYQVEATFNQYLFVLVYWIFLIFLSYRIKDNIITNKWVWFLFYIFCLYAFWCTDYFTYKYKFKAGYFDLDYKDPVYAYIQQYSYGSYILFRTLIWGSALFLYYKTIKRFDININFVAYVFCVFFLLTFSYARASLAMASYFYGISHLLINKNEKTIYRITLGESFIIISYFFHRSLLPLILLAPVCFVKFNKKLIFLSIVLFPIVSVLTNQFLADLLSDTIDFGASVSGFTDAATAYASYSNKAKNWKYMLTSFLDQSKFFIVYVYVLWIFVKNKSRETIDSNSAFSRLLTLTSIIIYIAFAFLTTSGNGATEVIGYRYLFMSGIPLTILIGYLNTNGKVNIRSLNLVLLYAGLYGLVFMVGKLLTYKYQYIYEY